MQVNSLNDGAGTITLAINEHLRTFQIKDIPEITTESVWRDALAGVEAESKDADKIVLPSLTFRTMRSWGCFRKTPSREYYIKSGFKEKVRLLAVDAQALADAKKHNTRNKVLACLLTAVKVALIIGAIFGIMAAMALHLTNPGVAALGVFLGLTAIITSVGHSISVKDNLKTLNKTIGFFSILGLGLPLTVYEACTRVSRLQAAHNTDLADVSARVAELVNFFDRKGITLEERITHCLNQYRHVLEKTKNIEVECAIVKRSLECMKEEIQCVVTRHKQALDELDAVIEFYKTPRVSVT
jgi:hypothetical protein